MGRKGVTISEHLLNYIVYYTYYVQLTTVPFHIFVLSHCSLVIILMLADNLSCVLKQPSNHGREKYFLQLIIFPIIEGSEWHYIFLITLAGRDAISYVVLHLKPHSIMWVWAFLSLFSYMEFASYYSHAYIVDSNVINLVLEDINIVTCYADYFGLSNWWIMPELL